MVNSEQPITCIKSYIGIECAERADSWANDDITIDQYNEKITILFVFQKTN